MALGEISSALSILERLRSWYGVWRKRKARPMESVATRFVRLCESHGVHRNQIPRFIGHGLTLSDVQEDAALLPKLTEDILEAACNRFAVRREWLDGAETQVHPCHDFYKWPEKFLSFIKYLAETNPGGNLQGVLIKPAERNPHSSALLILQETIGHIGEKPVYRYHLCNNWSYTYWKARAYLTACVAVAWKRDVYIHGIEKPGKTIQELEEGATLLGWRGEGIWALGRKTWDPEDMALSPEAFLNGIDSGQDNFCIMSGLKLWLELEQQGLMDAGFSANTRERFQEELAKYSSVAMGQSAAHISPFQE